MRLGIVGMLPGDFRAFRSEQMVAIRDLGFTGFGFHLNGDDVFDISEKDCAAYRRLIAAEDLDLAQFAITYDECLFQPDLAERERVSGKIQRGTEIAAQLPEQPEGRGVGCRSLDTASRQSSAGTGRTVGRDSETPGCEGGAGGRGVGESLAGRSSRRWAQNICV